MGMLNSMRDKSEGMYQGEEGKAPMAAAWLVQKVAEGKMSYGLSWRVKITIKKKSQVGIIVQKVEMTSLGANRRAMITLNCTRDKNEGMYRERAGTTPVTTACPEGC